MGITISNNNWDEEGNPTIYNGGTSTKNSVGEDISRPAQKADPNTNFQMTDEYKKYLDATPSAGSVATGKYGMDITGNYGVSMQRPDGTYWYQSTDKDGNPLIGGPAQYTDSEIASGIRIGGDTRTPDQIRKDTATTQDWQKRVRQPRVAPGMPGIAGGPGSGAGSSTGSSAGPLPGADPLTAGGNASAGGAVTGTTSTGNTQATNVGPAAFNIGNGSVSIQKSNPDGTINWSIWDGSKVTTQTLTKDQFAATYGGDLASKYYGATGKTEGQYKVDSWGGNSTFQAGGQTFTYIPQPDGSVILRSSNGTDFGKVAKQDFERYFGTDAALKVFSAGGMVPGLGGTGVGTQTGTGGQVNVGQGGVTSGNSTVGTSDWTTQAGHSFSLPDGTIISVTAVNPDGTITWRRSDGSVFSNVSRDVFESLVGKEKADQFYGKMTVGSTGGMTSAQTPDAAAGMGLARQPAQMDPFMREVDYSKETVQGQLQGMLAKGSPVLERMQGMALQGANARGLLNSTMAIQSGTAAVLDYATKIAEMDANVYNAKSRDNQQTMNAALGANMTAANQFQGAQLGSELKQLEMKTASDLKLTEMSAEQKNALERIVAEGDVKKALVYLENQKAAELNKFDNETRLMLQANQSATNLLSETNRNITAILTSTTITDPAEKQKRVDEYIASYRQGLALISKMTGDTDLSAYIDVMFTGGSGGNDSGTPSTSTGGTGTKTGGVVNL